MFTKKHLEPTLETESKGYVEHSGYVMVRKPEHPFSWSNGYVKLHRLVMELKLQRYLKPEEHVHHVDGNKKNNNIDNLEVVDMAEHRRIHNIEDKIYESKYDLELIRELYLEGYSTRKIAEMIGIGKSTVGYYIRKWGISRTEESGKIHENNPLNKKQILDEEIDKINKLRRNGVTVKKIVEETGYSRNTVYRYLDKELIS